MNNTISINTNTGITDNHTHAAVQALAALFDETDASIEKIEHLAKVFHSDRETFWQQLFQEITPVSSEVTEALKRLDENATFADLFAVLEPAA